MQTYWAQLALVGVLVVLNAAFAGSEMALVSLRESQLQRLERSGRAGRALARLARDPNRFLATIQIGITLAGFLASAAAAVSLAKPLVPLLSFLGDAAEPVAIMLVTLALTFVTLVFGELAPKRIAMQRAERWALVVAARWTCWPASPGRRCGRSAPPATWPYAWPGSTRSRSATRSARTSCATSSPATTASRWSSETIIAGAVEIADRHAAGGAGPAARRVHAGQRHHRRGARLVLAASGHSRAPVVGTARLDDTVGVVHLRDLVGVPDDGPWTSAPGRPCCCRTRCGWSTRCGSSRPSASNRAGGGRARRGRRHRHDGGRPGGDRRRDLRRDRPGRARGAHRAGRGAAAARHLPDPRPAGHRRRAARPRPAAITRPSPGWSWPTSGGSPPPPARTVHLDGWTLQVAEVKQHAISAVRVCRTAVQDAEHDALDSVES